MQPRAFSGHASGLELWRDANLTGLGLFPGPSSYNWLGNNFDSDIVAMIARCACCKIRIWRRNVASWLTVRSPHLIDPLTAVARLPHSFQASTIAKRQGQTQAVSLILPLR